MRKAHYIGDRDEYYYDLKKIVEVFADKDIEISTEEAKVAWQKYSDSMCAGWMMLGSDDNIFDSISHYFEIEE